MYVVLIHYPDPAKVEPYREAHRDFIRQGVKRGLIVVSGPREPRTGGVIVVDAATREEAAALVADDPYRRAGVATHEIIAFRAVNGTATAVLEASGT